MTKDVIMLSVCVCVFPGPPEPGRELRRAEALGRAPVLPAGQPQVQSHPGAAFPRLLLQSGRDAPQVKRKQVPLCHRFCYRLYLFRC